MFSYWNEIYKNLVVNIRLRKIFTVHFVAVQYSECSAADSAGLAAPRAAEPDQRSSETRLAWSNFFSFFKRRPFTLFGFRRKSADLGSITSVHRALQNQIVVVLEMIRETSSQLKHFSLFFCPRLIWLTSLLTFNFGRTLSFKFYISFDNQTWRNWSSKVFG